MEKRYKQRKNLNEKKTYVRRYMERGKTSRYGGEI